ncbi:MAG: hypothetical protein KAY24_18520 [Candidatus Eisenbacteria sp.]|nr:hypothetical protein [Candidatus Eisenbacteria bacterium]
MHRSSALITLFSVMLISGTIVLVPCGCSTDGNASSPDLSVAATGSDGYPPAMPSGLEVARRAAEGIKLTWNANTEEDLAGYRLYAYDPNPYRGDAYTCLSGAALLPNDRTYYLLVSADLTTGWNYFKLSAVDTEGYESALWGPLEFSYGLAADSEPRMEDPQGLSPDGIYEPGPGLPSGDEGHPQVPDTKLES